MMKIDSLHVLFVFLDNDFLQINTNITFPMSWESLESCCITNEFHWYNDLLSQSSTSKKMRKGVFQKGFITSQP